MKILHVITKLEFGGAQQNTLHTCAELARRGHDVILAAGPGGILDGQAAVGPFHAIFLPDLRREISLVRDLRALLRLTRLMRAEQPDVVHLHSSKAGALGRLAAAMARVRVVVHSIHGWSFAAGMPRSRRIAYEIIERLCAPLTDHFIAVSRRDLELGERKGIVPRGKGSVIRSGFDLASFAPSADARRRIRAAWSVGDDEVLVVNVSNFKPQKAPLDFIRAAGTAARAAPSLRFAYVGDGELRPQVEAAVADEGLSSRMILAGWRDDVADILRAADVFALGSLWEGLPRSVVQARACGLPVVATSVNGVPEVVEHGVTGLLVAPGRPGEMAEALVRLASDAGLRARMGEAARAGLEEFSAARMVDEQEALYGALLRRRALP